MNWIMRKIREAIERRNSPEKVFERHERKMRRCPALKYEDLRCSEKELEECERMIEEARQRILKREEQNNCSTCTK